MAVTDVTEKLRRDDRAKALAAGTEKPKDVREMMIAYSDQIQVALPSHMDANRLARIVTTEMRKTPALNKCNPISMFGAVIQCAQLGLEPGNSLGHAYLIPFKDQVQLIVGYRGMIDLARRSGQIVSISARSVREGDEFEYQYGLHEDIVHRPAGDESKPIIYVYAVAQLQGGGRQFEVMSRKEIESIQKQSKAGKSGPWISHWEEMAKKTVIRRLFKYLPVSIEIAQATDLNDQADIGVDQCNAAILEGEFDIVDEPTEQPA